MSEEAKWYVIHTYSGYENIVASNIQKTIENNSEIGNLIHEVKIPTETVVEIKNNQEHEVERKIFPGYVFVKMILNNSSWYVVRNTRGCTGFVGDSNKPIPLSAEDVAKFGVEKKRVQISFGVGDLVRITDGPYKDTTGTVKTIDENSRLATITIYMLGREVSAEVELNKLELAYN